LVLAHHVPVDLGELLGISSPWTAVSLGPRIAAVHPEFPLVSAHRVQSLWLDDQVAMPLILIILLVLLFCGGGGYIGGIGGGGIGLGGVLLILFLWYFFFRSGE
jgi:hypothetical protein